MEYENEGRPLERTSRGGDGGMQQVGKQGQRGVEGVAKLNVDPFDILRLRLPFLG